MRREKVKLNEYKSEHPSKENDINEIINNIKYKFNCKQSINSGFSRPSGENRHSQTDGKGEFKLFLDKTPCALYNFVVNKKRKDSF